MAGSVMITHFTLLLIKAQGFPRWSGLKFKSRSEAVKFGQTLINRSAAKVVVVYRGDKPTQLLVYRPQTYVHLERI